VLTRRAGDATTPPVLTAAQAAHLWRRVVANDLRTPLLTDAAGAAALAGEAWERLHAFAPAARAGAAGTTAVGEDPPPSRAGPRAIGRRCARRRRSTWRRWPTACCAQRRRGADCASGHCAGRFVEPTAQQRRLPAGSPQPASR
jgi:hypothetical protein